jgi:hypothetical protein
MVKILRVYEAFVIFWLYLGITSSFSRWDLGRPRYRHYPAASMRQESSDPDLDNFLNGQYTASKPWAGTRDILVRRKQVPEPEYSPREVVKVF